VIAVSYVQPLPGHASSHGHTTTLAIKTSVLQAPTCVTFYCHTCDETWILHVSSVKWKHFYSGVSQLRRIVTVCSYKFALEILLLTNLTERLVPARVLSFFLGSKNFDPAALVTWPKSLFVNKLWFRSVFCLF